MPTDYLKPACGCVIFDAMQQPSGGLSLACGEVRGGNEPVYQTVDLPGLHCVLYSRPCQGARGGDVHYLSVCGSGLLARVCVADVTGHGEVVAAVSTQMHAHLRNSVDVIDERSVFRTLDRRLQDMGIRAMTTAALLTYYPPSRRLTTCSAGHPPGWLLPVGSDQWLRLAADGEATIGMPTNLPLGSGFESDYQRSRRRAAIGDQVLILTDGVLDTENESGVEFGPAGVERALAAAKGGTPDEVLQSVLSGLNAHGAGRPDMDDITIFVAQVVAGPPGPAVWHVLKNRLLTRL